MYNSDNEQPSSLTKADDSNQTKLHEPIVFEGVGGEFFRIWIVNVIYTVLSLGIYGPWAKVRTNQYFYGKTKLQDFGFRYLADPKLILKGRIFAVLAFMAYSGLSEVVPILGAVLLVLFALATPMIMNSALRFNAVNTSYKGVRFGFKGSYWGAFLCFILLPFLNIFTLGFLLPYIAKKGHHYIVSNSTFGQTPFEFTAATGKYYRVFFMVVLYAIAVTAGAVLLHGLGFKVIAMLLVYVSFFLVGAFIKLQLLELYFKNTTLEHKRFYVKYSVKDFLKIKIVNVLLTGLTLGLYYPYAKVRMACYMAEQIEVRGTGNLDVFTSAEQQRSKAFGEELGEVFDMDIGFI